MGGKTMIRRTLFATALFGVAFFACIDAETIKGIAMVAGGLTASGLILALTYREEDWK
jgi:hypothetical protein